jgi:hypothetical protein
VFGKTRKREITDLQSHVSHRDMQSTRSTNKILIKCFYDRYEAFKRLYNLTKHAKYLVIAGVTIGMMFIADTKIVLNTPCEEVYRRRIKREWDRFHKNYDDIRSVMLTNSCDSIQQLEDKYYELAHKYIINTPIFLPPSDVEREYNDYMDHHVKVGYKSASADEAVGVVMSIVGGGGNKKL